MAKSRGRPARGHFGGDLGGDVFGLIALRRIGGEANRRSFFVFREQLLGLAALVTTNQFLRDTQNSLRAAIVLLQPHHVDFRVVLFKIEDVAQIGPGQL